MEQASGAASYRALLRNRNYALLWGGQVVSAFGDRLHQIGLLVLVGALTGNDLLSVGLVFVTIGLPELLFGLFAGALVDRMDRRRVMIAADLCRFLVVAVIPFLATAGLAWVYAATFLLTTATLFFRPAKDAIIPSIVPEDALMRANSLSEASENATDVLGFPLAGAMVGGLTAVVAGDLGLELVFYLDALTYALSALMVYRMAVATEARAGLPGTVFRGLLAGVAEGLRHLRSNTPVLTNTALMAVAAVFSLGTFTLAYGYATEVTHTGALGYSVLEAAVGLGAVLGGLAVGRWGERFSTGPLILVGIVVTGLADGSLALFANLWLAVAAQATAGAGHMLLLIPSVTLVQRLIPEEFLGRVFGARGILFSLAIIAANALMGVGAEYLGVRPMWGITGASLVLVGLVGFLLPSARDVR